MESYSKGDRPEGIPRDGTTPAPAPKDSAEPAGGMLRSPQKAADGARSGEGCKALLLVDENSSTSLLIFGEIPRPAWETQQYVRRPARGIVYRGENTRKPGPQPLGVPDMRIEPSPVVQPKPSEEKPVGTPEAEKSKESPAAREADSDGAPASAAAAEWLAPVPEQVTPPKEEAAAAQPAEEKPFVADTQPAGDKTAPKPAPAPLSDAEVLAKTAQKWKYKAVPPLEPEPAEEILTCDERNAASRVIGARVRGKKHKHEGTNCDDWFASAAVGNVTVAAVADGAGSRRFSRIGARVSCEAAVQFLEQEFTKLIRSEQQHQAIVDALSQPLDSAAFQTAVGTLCSFVQQAVADAVRAVERAYAERRDKAEFQVNGRQLELADLACTLIVAAAVPAGNGEHVLISCQVGDGTIASLDTAGPFPEKVRILADADSGEFSGQTEFITSDRFKQLPVLQSRTRVHRGRNDLVMLMTDGVADDYHPGETQITGLYYDMIANGILERPGDTVVRTASPAKVPLPEPTAYPWVNNQDVAVPLNYTERIMETSGLSLAELWERRDVLAQARAKLPAPQPQEAKERLAAWLDNYVQRGSFDDRTLVLMLLDGGGS